MRALTLLTCAALVGGVSARAAQATFAGSAKEAAPGSYVVLPFAFDGDGDYTFEISAPAGWTALVAQQKLHVDGHTLVPFTFKVPALAPMGSTPFTLTVRQNGQPVGQAQAQVTVLRRVAVGLHSPALLGVPIGQIGHYPVTVTNLGNAPDTIRLHFDISPDETLLSQNVFTLAPGQSAQTEVILGRRGKRDSGSAFLFTLLAVSDNDAQQLAVQDTQVTWGVGASSTSDQTHDPQLSIALSAGVLGTLNFGAAGTSYDLDYSLNAALGGNLSDYYTSTLSSSPLTGGLHSLLPALPSLTFGLSNGDWGASLSVGTHGVGASGNFNYNGLNWTPQLGLVWGLNAGGALGYSAGLGATGALGPGQFSAQLGSAGITGANAIRTDSLYTAYRVNLAPGWNFDIEPSVQGVSTPAGYSVLFGVGQNSSYQGKDFDISESAGSNLRDFHTISVAGGLRNVSPFGVRASASAVFTPQGTSWNSAALLLASPGGGFGASLLGTLAGTPGALNWSVSPSASYSFGVGQFSAALAATYTLYGGTAGSAQGLNLALGLNAGRFGASTNFSYQGPGAGLTPQSSLGVTASYLLTSTDVLGASYIQYFGALGSTTLSGSYTHVWNDALQSSLAYSRSWSVGGTTEGAAVGLAWSGVGVDGLALVGTYGVSAPNSLFRGNLEHRVTLGLQYDNTLHINTPKSVVQLFGGRKGGDVSGQLYLDKNMNGLRDPGEAALSGITVQAGSESAVTDAQGHYRLRLPSGSYTLKLSGLPTTLAPLAPLTASVTENSAQTLDAALVPVNTLDVAVFQDDNGNGVLDAGEQPIPYAGVTVTGPVQRRLAADSGGVAHFSALPAGVYSVGIDGAQLPAGFKQTGDNVRVTISDAAKPDGVVLGAGLPPRTQDVTFTGTSIGLMALPSSTSLNPGDDLTVQLYLSGPVTTASVQAFGQTYPVPGDGSQRSVTFKVPPGTAPGSYPVNISAEGPSGIKASSLSINVP